MSAVQILLTVLFWYAIIGLFCQSLVFIVGGVKSFIRARGATTLGLSRLLGNRFVPSVSVIIPAHNERQVIVDSVRSLLSMGYPSAEVIVVDDGSTDGMFTRLTEEFDLEEVPWVGSELVPQVGRTVGVFGSRAHAPLLVVRKESTGTRADAVNGGINHARGTLLCFVDADSVLQDGALLTVARHFAYAPEEVVGAGGAIRVANGCDIQDGALGEVRIPREAVARIQVNEYARSFTLGRSGWSAMRGLLIISGAFGLYRRDAVIAAGGLDAESFAEDADLLLRTTKVARASGRPFRMVIEPAANCWTQVPGTFRDLGTQRRRWSRGLVQLLGVHKDMILNPRYGTLGLFAIPYFILWEVLAPFALALGMLLIVVGLFTGQITVSEALYYVAWLSGFGMLIVAFGLLAEEVTLSPYRGVLDGLRVWLLGLSESFWYVWLHAVWRARGTLEQWFRRPGEWGVLQRSGFDEADDGDDGDDGERAGSG